jgi:hypothetical protein
MWPFRKGDVVNIIIIPRPCPRQGHVGLPSLPTSLRFSILLFSPFVRLSGSGEDHGDEDTCLLRFGFRFRHATYLSTPDRYLGT